MVNKQQIVRWIELFATELKESKDYLTKLDSAIGDADRGINMNRGFQKVMTKLSDVADKDIGTILKTVSLNLISSVGGASRPLYGTLFLRASNAAAGKDELSERDMAAVLDAAVECVVQRGRANLGDKTMLDVLTPASKTFKEAVNQGANAV